MKKQQCLHLLGPVRMGLIAGSHKDPAGDLPSSNGSWDTLRFRSRRAAALLGYLAAEQRPVSRTYLAGLLWPDEPLSDGRANLRRELYSLTQLIPDCWKLDRQAVTFSPSENLIVDIYVLLQLEAQDSWAQAVDLLGGEFLEALHLDNNSEFESWLMGERNRWRWRTERLLTKFIEGQILRGRYRDALQCSQRLLQFAPWNEENHRMAMRLLTWTGQRGAALRQFEYCKKALKEELDVEPSKETVALARKIQTGKLDLPPQLPAFLVEEVARHEIVLPPIFSREYELGQLHKAMQMTLKGQGRVLFIVGDAGRGKTALMETFAQQAMSKYPNLLVANGKCNAYSGVGQPYLPFRGIMAMLTGDVEAKWDAGAISREHAIRLWEAFPIVSNALLAHAPDTLDMLVQGNELSDRVSIFQETNGLNSLMSLNEMIKEHQINTHSLKSSFIFHQIANMLAEVAKHKPLLLILDDLQWADKASLSLLFHLGRRLAETNDRILILCGLRPEEVYTENGGDRHPLLKLINEFKRIFGEEAVELRQLGKQDARRFVNELLDSEPNKLGEQFRSGMLQRTGAHPLFTIEMLRALQTRGDLCKDGKGNWIAAADLDWNILPVKVEAVIKERIERLDPELKEILSVASIVGEVFTAEIIADVQEKDERVLLRQLSLELERQHRLVREQEGFVLDGKYFSRFKFTHILFQQYFYDNICEGERRILHANVANTFEELFRSHLDLFPVELAHHFNRAGDFNRAIKYYIRAAEHASRIYANSEAITHYSKAIELLNKVSMEDISQANIYQERGSIYEILGQFDLALKDFSAALRLANKGNGLAVKWRTLISLGNVWASRDYRLAKEYLDEALSLARNLKRPELVAENLNWIGNWYTNADKPQTAFRYHQEALSIISNLNTPNELANTLDLLGISDLMSGNLKGCVGYYQQAIEHYREMDNRFRLISSLTGRAASYSMLALLTLVSHSTSLMALSDVSEAIHIAEETCSLLVQTWPYWAIGLFYTIRGRFGEALSSLEYGLKTATEIQHPEFIIGQQFGLGLLFIEMFETDQAIVHLKKSLAMANDLNSRIHINISSGLLARAYIIQKNIDLAKACLDEVMTDQTPMNTAGKRLCWLCKAEIALYQGEPNLALNIIDKLISTAPGIETGDVISYLWMLKGETLRRLGKFDQAITYLLVARDHAKEMEELFLSWRIHAILGRTYYAINQLDNGEIEISSSKAIIKELASTLSDESRKEKFVQEAYKTLGVS